MAKRVSIPSDCEVHSVTRSFRKETHDKMMNSMKIILLGAPFEATLYCLDMESVPYIGLLFSHHRVHGTGTGIFCKNIFSKALYTRVHHLHAAPFACRAYTAHG